MKRWFLTPLLLSWLFFAGCETTELTVEDDAESLAPALGVQAEEIQYLGRGNFVVKRLRTMGGRYYPRGIILLTQDEIRVYSRYQTLIMSKSYEELAGVSMVENQLHVKDEVEKMVLELGRDPLRIDNTSEREKVYGLLTGFKVASFEMTRAHDFHRSQFRDAIHSDSISAGDDYAGPVALPE